MQKIIPIFAALALAMPALAQKPAEPDKFAVYEFCSYRGRDARFIMLAARSLDSDSAAEMRAEIEADQTAQGPWRRAALADARSQAQYNPPLFGRKWEDRCIADPKAFGFKP